jgi:hypothetical protein
MRAPGWDRRPADESRNFDLSGTATRPRDVVTVLHAHQLLSSRVVLLLISAARVWQY